MGNTKHTINFRVRLSYLEDMELIQRLAESGNVTAYIRDALTYFINHEKEAMEELHGDGVPQRRMYAKRARNEVVEEAINDVLGQLDPPI